MSDFETGDWRVHPLGDLIELFDHLRVPLNSRERAERKGRYPYYGAQGIIDSVDGYLFDGRFLLVAEDGENLNSRKLPLALVAAGKFWVNNHAHVLRGIATKVDDMYLLAALNHADIKSLVTGAAQPKLSQANLRLIKIRVPPLRTQRAIAAVLSAYDDLIENCERRIRVLEEMARALYREWFVLFRYPGHEKARFVDSPMGRIPEGWSATPIKDQCEFLSRGISPSYAEDGASLVLNQKCIREQRVLIAAARRQSKPVPTDRLLRVGDVLINSTGVGTLGRVAQVLEHIENATVDTHVTIARAVSDVDPTFFGCALLDLQGEFERKGVGATGQTELSRAAIGETLLANPHRTLQKRFGAIAGPLRRATASELRRIENLRTTRDLLLPRLMSGKIALREGDSAVAAE